jgi:hypothetical protein
VRKGAAGRSDLTDQDSPDHRLTKLAASNDVGATLAPFFSDRLSYVAVRNDEHVAQCAQRALGWVVGRVRTMVHAGDVYMGWGCGKKLVCSSV